MKSIKQNRHVNTTQQGFTLIELVIVIIIVGILAITVAPKMLNLQDDASVASVQGTAGAFKSGVDLARSVYLVKSGKGEVEDLKVFENNQAADPDYPYEQPGHLDFNQYGWPVQSYIYPDSTHVQLDNADDCVSLWHTLFANGEPTVSRESEAKQTDYIAHYIRQTGSSAVSQQCRYDLRRQPKLSISYNAITGKVSSDTDLSS